MTVQTPFAQVVARQRRREERAMRQIALEVELRDLKRAIFEAKQAGLDTAALSERRERLRAELTELTQRPPGSRARPLTFAVAFVKTAELLLPERAYRVLCERAHELQKQSVAACEEAQKTGISQGLPTRT